MSGQDLAADVAATIDARLAQRLADAQRRREQQQADRARRTARRTAGLRQRHAAKLARADPMDPPKADRPIEPSPLEARQ